MTPPSATKACKGNIVAGSAARCAPTSDAMMQACLPSTFTLRCPDNTVNRSAGPDYATANSLKCRACGFKTDVRDKNPTKGNYWISLAFGALATRDGSILPPSELLAYKVAWVDREGRRLADVASVYVTHYSATCCDATLFRLTVRGAYPAGASRLALQPMSRGGNLPYVDFTDVVDDLTEGQVLKVEGEFTLKASSLYARVFTKSHLAKWALQEALADTLGGGVDAEDVFIKAIYLNGNKVVSRRLAPAEMKIEYMIATTDTTRKVDSRSFAPVVLKSHIHKQARRHLDLPLVITTGPVVAEPWVWLEGKPKPKLARTSCAPALIFRGLAALAVWLIVSWN